MSKVHFLDYSREPDVLPGIDRLCNASGILKAISKGDSVAVKAAHGRTGQCHLRPARVRAQSG